MVSFLIWQMQSNVVEYEEVITTVGNILLSYDTDGAVPTFGFGAKLSEPCMHSALWSIYRCYQTSLHQKLISRTKKEEMSVNASTSMLTPLTVRFMVVFLVSKFHN